MTIQLRSHKVLGRMIDGIDINAICFNEGDFSEIIFMYTNVSFTEDIDNDKLIMHFKYEVLDVPTYREGYDKIQFEKELGDFMVQLLYYGLERDHLGYIDGDNNSTDNSIKLGQQRGILS